MLLSIFVISFGEYHSLERSVKTVSLDAFPKQIGGWNYVTARSFSKDVEAMLDTDDYIDYTYRSPENIRAEVLISYFSSMREGKQFHSPKNCMLGSGWETLETRRLFISWRNKAVPVNYMLVRRNERIFAVLYWMQGRGRLLDSEYLERIYRVIDSFKIRRTDGAFVRIMLENSSGDHKRDRALLAALGQGVASELDAIIRD
ncbi:MAG: exosortase C-terminal domain/associated protein EpsI [Syntrophaceae bacterium]